MGITLFNLMNNTPDRVRSLDNGPDSGEKREFTWFLRDKNNPGLNVKLLSVPKENAWQILIHRVDWKENEFVESEDPIYEYTQDSSDEAISCAETKVKDICDQNKELEHCINFLRN